MLLELPQCPGRPLTESDTTPVSTVLRGRPWRVWSFHRVTGHLAFIHSFSWLVFIKSLLGPE